MKHSRREQAAQLTLRREALVAEGRSQRTAICNALSQLEPPLRLLNVAIRIGRYVHARPWTVALPLVVVGLLARRRLGSILALLASGVRLWRALRR